MVIGLSSMERDEKYINKLKKANDTKLLKILEAIILHREKVILYNMEYSITAYSILGEFYPCTKSGDEEAPKNQGVGWNLRDTIISMALSEDVLNSSFLLDEIKQIL